jgi:hypothetical protein
VFAEDGRFDTAPPPSILPLRSGVDFSVEDDAEKILAEDRRRLRAQGLDVDYLTADQLALRWSRELIGPYGAPDRALSHGMYRRAYNPWAGQRPVKLKQADE